MFGSGFGRSRWRQLIAWLLASLLLATPATARVALWQIANGKTQIWLLGTIHALPPHTRWHNPAIDQAIASAGGLVLETVVDPDPVKTTALIQSLGTQPGLPPLVDRIDPKQRPQLEAMIADTHVPPAVFDRLKTWAAAFLLVGLTVHEVGADAGSGVESDLAQRFAATKRPIIGLETPAQQLGFFNTLSEPEQRRFLADTIDTKKKDKADFKAMLKAWLDGDPKGIAKTFATEKEISPVLRDVLIRKRNAAWADWLAKRLQQPGKLLVAVGAGHLAGPDSVQAMLEARGIKVVRVD